MSDETPSDEELLEWWKGTHWSDPKPSDFGSLRLAFNAGRASVTPPTKEAIAEAADKAFPETEWTQPSTLFAFRQAFISGGLAVLDLFAVPPTESEGK